MVPLRRGGGVAQFVHAFAFTRAAQTLTFSHVKGPVIEKNKQLYLK